MIYINKMLNIVMLSVGLIICLVLVIIGYKLYTLYVGEVISEAEVADKRVNNTYRNSDFDTAVTFHKFDL